VIDNDYAQYFGFLESEVLEGLAYHDHLDDFPAVKAKYDGYRFGDANAKKPYAYPDDPPLTYPINIYNPWSVLRYLGTEVIESFWIGIGTYELIKDCLAYFVYQKDSLFYKLANNKAVNINISRSMTYDNVKDSPENVFTLLLHAGFLKVLSLKRVDANNNDLFNGKVQLVNREVRSNFKGTFNAVLNEKGLTPIHAQKFIDSLEDQYIFGIKQILNIVIEGCSTFNYEQSYQMAIALLTRFDPQRRYKVQTEYRVPHGRIDVLLTIANSLDVAYILELKRGDETIEDKGLCQIESKYKQAIIDEGYKKIVPLEIIFHELKVKIVKFGEVVEQ
jgi:hypothetical protein